MTPRPGRSTATGPGASTRGAARRRVHAHRHRLCQLGRQGSLEVSFTVAAGALAVTTPGPFTVAEGETDVTTLAASDTGTGGTASWSIPAGTAGGADGAAFALTPEGVLTLVAAKDFEAPDDADGDGTYQVTVEVREGRAERDRGAPGDARERERRAGGGGFGVPGEGARGRGGDARRERERGPGCGRHADLRMDSSPGRRPARRALGCGCGAAGVHLAVGSRGGDPTGVHAEGDGRGRASMPRPR